MKKLLYTLLMGATVLALATPPAAPAHASRLRLTDNPAAPERKAAPRSKAPKKLGIFKHSSRHKNSLVTKMRHGMRVMLGLEPSKAVTSPRKLSRQLHANQRQRHAQNRMASRSRWRLCN